MAPPSFDLRVPHRCGAASPRPATTAPQAASSAGIEPRDWQRRLIQLLRARLVQAGRGGHDVLIHAGPGAGKTLGALLGFQRMEREGRLDRFVVFTHRSSIARQWLAAAERLDLDLREWPLPTGKQSGTEGLQGLLISYQSAARHRSRLEREWPRLLAGRTWLAIADEVHHLGLDPDEPEATAWGHAFTGLTAGARLRLGLSGTPFRADSLAFCAARRLRVEQHGTISERIVPDLCVEPRRLIIDGDVRPLEFRFQDGTVEHGRRSDDNAETSPLSAEQRESWRARNLRRAIRLGDGGGIAMRLLLQARQRLERLRGDHPGAGGLVIARDIAHARCITALLQEQGDRVHLAHSQDPDAATHLADFRAGVADWLVSIDMCAEGFDAPRIRVVAYLTTVVTRSRFVQAITRAVRIDEGRGAVEPVPRHPSYVYAPADPLLISHARSWSLSEPYLIRQRTLTEPEACAGSGRTDLRLSLQALADDAGAVIALSGPELPHFLVHTS
jgi:superfamily II DNA or RNA helicase